LYRRQLSSEPIIGNLDQRDFDSQEIYPEDSIKQKLQIQMISDNVDDDGRLHQDKICRDKVWSGIMDVIALTDILKINIVMLIMVKKGYTVQPFVYKKNAKTIFVKYNGVNHFEPLIPLFNVKSPSVKHLDSSKSLSPKTKRMIEEMDKMSKSKSVSTETKRIIEEIDKMDKMNKGKPLSAETKKILKKMNKASKSKKSIEITVNCPSDKDFNPKTKRCVKKCPAGFTRNEQFKCHNVTKKNKLKEDYLKEDSLKEDSLNEGSLKDASMEMVIQGKRVKHCPSDKDFNPKTKRCVKKCPAGFTRNEQFKCHNVTKRQ
jgi:hypothetical protein